ncbi:MAG: hypothetical protein LC104_03090 [Bacteroidales bacterium]|nr:hypothetical protein [Bacteroidales bacterium]
MNRNALDSIVGLVTDRDLVFTIFAVYSRFEYALKRTNFLKARDKAEPDWDKYSNSIRGQLLVVDNAEFRQAVRYLFAEPPKTQVIAADGQLKWQPTTRGQGETDERYLLRLVGTVRNNLFHGGKYPDPFGPVPDVGRNQQLLESSITVLETCLVISPAVGSAFAEVA